MVEMAKLTTHDMQHLSLKCRDLHDWLGNSGLGEVYTSERICMVTEEIHELSWSNGGSQKVSCGTDWALDMQRDYTAGTQQQCNSC